MTKTYQQLREECRVLRAAHKKIKVERDEAIKILQGLVDVEKVANYDKVKWIADLEHRTHRLLGLTRDPLDR